MRISYSNIKNRTSQFLFTFEIHSFLFFSPLSLSLPHFLSLFLSIISLSLIYFSIGKGLGNMVYSSTFFLFILFLGHGRGTISNAKKRDLPSKLYRDVISSISVFLFFHLLSIINSIKQCVFV